MTNKGVLKSHVPEPIIFQRYADLLVNFNLGSGKGVQPGETVFVWIPDFAKPMLSHIQAAIIKAGGHPIFHIEPSGIEFDFYMLASLEQAAYFPEKYWSGIIEESDHFLMLRPHGGPEDLVGIDPEKTKANTASRKPYWDQRDAKELAGNFTWVIGWYPTQEYAELAGMTLEEYWNEVIKACHLNLGSPVKKWKKIQKQIFDTRKKLDALNIHRLHVEGDGIDLWVKVGEHRRFLGGTGRNLPSYETFFSPDRSGTAGYIEFNEPLSYNGVVIRGIRLEFENGKVTKATSETHQDVLLALISIENADYIGEFSLTDAGLSNIRKYMACTLFDENKGGEWGNFHLALGKGFPDSLTVRKEDMSEEEWKDLGLNDSAAHVDIISTSRKKVTAYFEDNTFAVIYEDGKFIF